MGMIDYPSSSRVKAEDILFRWIMRRYEIKSWVLSLIVFIVAACVIAFAL